MLVFGHPRRGGTRYNGLLKEGAEIPMFLSVHDMDVRKVRFEETFAPGEIPFLDRRLTQETPLFADGSAELVAGAGGEIRVRGRLRVRMAAECDRCLEAVSFPVETSFDLFYEPATVAGLRQEAGITPGESEIDFYEESGLELEDVLREQVLLALPMQRICKPDCQGICPVCGQNRNLSACACQPRPVDDRWAALRNL